MDKTRRDFLKILRNGIPLVFLNKFIPRAFMLGELFSATAGANERNAKPHFFLLIESSGGMDVTLGIDPILNTDGLDEHDVFLEQQEKIIQAGNLHLGPAALALAPHAADIALINGVFMRQDLGHEACRSYMTSGGLDASANLAVELGCTAGLGPVGVVIDSQIETGSRSILITQASDFIDGEIGEETSAIIGQTLALKSPRLSTSPLMRLRESLENSRPAVKKLGEYIEEMKKTVEKPENYHVVGAAFLEGAARQARIVLEGDGRRELDTHSNHAGNHLKAQSEVWQKVADIFKFFKSVPFGDGSLFDSTTFMVISEFSRTPALNTSNGKDHNPNTNSVLLAGKGINSNQIFGRSNLIPRKLSKKGYSQHIASPYDYILGRPVQKPFHGMQFIYPENVIQTMAQVFGNPDDFSVATKNFPRIPGVAKR